MKMIDRFRATATCALGALPLSLSMTAESAADDRTIPVGGQAVIEGVLMRGPKHWGLVVREPSGSMWRKAWLGSEWLKRGAWKLPIVRGFASMVDMMRIGTRALTLSAQRALGEDDKFSPLDIVVTIAFSILLVCGLFIALPMWLSETISESTGSGKAVENILEGVMRGAVFVAYIALASLLRDIRRVFSYHGAEHKTINAFENGDAMTLENVRMRSRIHRRCGTSFMVIVVVVSIIVFSCLSGGPFWMRALARVLLLPLVIGVSYELIKGASKSDTWGRVMIMPALTLQYLTTREPDDQMIEVAIRSLDVALDPYASLSGMEDDRDSFEKIDDACEVSEDGSLEQTRGS